MTALPEPTTDYDDRGVWVPKRSWWEPRQERWHFGLEDWNTIVWMGGRFDKKQYELYQKSPEWEVSEAFCFQVYDHVCADCGETAEVMHHTPEGYRHLGKELPGLHTEALCRRCHAIRHGKIEMWDQVDTIRDKAA